MLKHNNTPVFPPLSTTASPTLCLNLPVALPPHDVQEARHGLAALHAGRVGPGRLHHQARLRQRALHVGLGVEEAARGPQQEAARRPPAVRGRLPVVGLVGRFVCL